MRSTPPGNGNGDDCGYAARPRGLDERGRTRRFRALAAGGDGLVVQRRAHRSRGPRVRPSVRKPAGRVVPPDAPRRGSCDQIALPHVRRGRIGGASGPHSSRRWTRTGSASGWGGSTAPGRAWLRSAGSSGASGVTPRACGAFPVCPRRPVPRTSTSLFPAASVSSAGGGSWSAGAPASYRRSRRGDMQAKPRTPLPPRTRARARRARVSAGVRRADLDARGAA